MSSFSFGGGGGFGFGQSQPAQSPFGGTAAPFGQTSAPFGQQQASSPFGAGSSPGMFGASQPAFGAQSTPAFGVSSTPAFGTGGFGAGGFGAGSSNPFGGASQPAFGAASTPAFGASTPAFGSTGFGASAPAFGATPAFGASTPAFGSSTPAPFGSPSGTPAFGASTPAFGAGFGLTGGSSFGGQGTRGVPFQKQAEADSSATGGQKTTVYYNSISAMPAYSSKSHEELRWEDYQAGVKGNTGTGSPGGSFGQPSGGLFGQTQASAPFGQPSAPAFGVQSSPAFGPASTPSMFGGNTTPAQGGGFGFGSTTAFGVTSAPAFGVTTTPAFGQTSAAPFGNPTFGGAFGQSSAASVFGPSTTPSLFPSSTPGFGSTSSSFAVGGSIFGQTQASPGAFGQPLAASSAASSLPFTFNTGGAFGASASSLFSTGGAFGASAPGFGQTSSSIFGQPQAKPFGGSLFGPQSSPGFNTPQSQSAFNASSIFGQPSSPGMFGAPNAFNFSPQGGQQQQQQQTQQQLAPAQPLGVATSPYGMLPVAPEVGTPPIPENRVGIAARPMSGLGPPRQTAFVAARSLTPRSGARLRPTLARRVSRLSASPAEQLLDSDGGSDAVSSPATSIFVMRDNPRQFFVRQPLPSTASAQKASPAPSKQPEEAPSEGTANEGKGKAKESKGKAKESKGKAKEGSQDGPTERGPSDNGHAPSKPGKEPAAAGGEPAREPKKPQKPQDTGKGRLTDDQVAELLPKLSEDDYSVEPSLTQLAAMAREDPQSLASVSGFKISRRGVGSVRWLEPTDVRGMDVNDTVRLTKGAVEVYLDVADKPEVGEGLNRAAEVTLHKVYKLDKATNRPSTDPADFEKYERKLKKLAAAQSARFISYDGKSGTWVFEVEHFSRYGLPEEDSDDEEVPSKPGSAPRDQGKAAAGTPAQEPEEEGMQLSDEDEDGVESQQGMGIFDAAMAMPGAEDAEHLANSPVMHVALSARLGLDPSQMAMYRSDMFPSGSRAAVSTGRRKRAQSRSPVTGAAEAFESQAPRAGPSQPREPAQAEAKAAPAAQPAVTSWREGPAALQPPSGRAEGGAPGQADQAGAGAVMLSSAGRSQHAAPAASEALGLVDAGLMAGHSFRVGWAPGGRLARIRRTAGDSASSIAVASTPFGEGVLPDASSSGSNPEAEAAVRLRERCKAMLEVHMRHSSPREATTGSAAATTRQRAMQCSRSGELHGVVQELLKALSEHAAKHGADNGDSVEAVIMRHERQTWELIDVLFSEIQAEVIDEEPQDAPMGAEGAFCAEPEGWSAAAERRSRLSTWLRDQASSKVDAALRETGSELLHLAQLLTGQRMAAAVSLACASGDIRLAMLLSQATARSNAREEVAKQLALWQDAGFGSHMDAGRMLIYELLAGHVNRVVPQMQLDWRRAFALHLWYGEPPAAALAASLEAYEQAIQEGAAPPPLPLYMEGHPPIPHLDQLETAPIDVDYRLMELAAGGPSRADPAFLATLLAPLALSPDPLDYLFPWMLLQFLQAIDAIPDTASSDEVCAVHMSLISQLERLGGLEEWALYIALHLPDGAQADKGSARDDLVLQLLHRYAPVWAASKRKQEFLIKTLGLPQAWLASALATFAAYKKSRASEASSGYLRLAEEEFEQRVAAGDWAAAHELFAEELAPRWWLSDQRPRVRSGLQLLLHAAQEAQAEVGSGQWRIGAELYSAFFHLEDMYKSRSPLYDEDDTVAHRMEAVTALGRLLQQTATISSDKASAQRQLYRQAVYSSMSKHLADCMLTDGGHAPEDITQRQLVSVSLQALPETSRMHHIQIAAAALGEVLA